jgi:hypothetical protein
MILECTLDELMENVRCYEFVDIRTGKVVRERLWIEKLSLDEHTHDRAETNHQIAHEAIFIP